MNVSVGNGKNRVTEWQELLHLPCKISITLALNFPYLFFYNACSSKEAFCPDYFSLRGSSPMKRSRIPSPLFPFFMFSSSNYTELLYTVFCSEHCNDLYDFSKKPQKTKNPSTPRSPPVRLSYDLVTGSVHVLFSYSCVIFCILSCIQLSYLL